MHVDDVASAVLLTLDAHRLARRSYTITGDSFLTLGDVAATVRKVLPDADITMDAGRDPVDDVQARFDISAAQPGDLRYRPRIELEAGIRDYARAAYCPVSEPLLRRR